MNSGLLLDRQKSGLTAALSVFSLKESKAWKESEPRLERLGGPLGALATQVKNSFARNGMAAPTETT